MSKYFCGKCGAEVKPTDTICPNCGRNLSEVGRNITVEITETIGLSDKMGLANTITGSLVDVSNATTFASSFIDAIPEEKRKELGITQDVLSILMSINKDVKQLAEKTPRYVMINQGTIIWQTSQQGDNIVASSNIEETFNRISQEVKRTDVDAKIKSRAESIINEVKKEIGKEKPDKGKILKMWDEFKTLVPLVAPLLAAILKKVLFG
jgi:RNA polymerase subunit RPABC4/transcription elongation factor Spt4